MQLECVLPYNNKNVLKKRTVSKTGLKGRISRFESINASIKFNHCIWPIGIHVHQCLSLRKLCLLHILNSLLPSYYLLSYFIIVIIIKILNMCQGLSFSTVSLFGGETLLMAGIMILWK